VTLQDQFGNIDIYVFDQLLRGRIAEGMRVFDAGCGGGRNLVYLLREGYDVCGNDADANAVSQVRAMAAAIAPDAKPDLRVEPIERTSFPDAHADVVIASAVLHFARDPDHFEAMLRQLWRVLRPGGVFFARLASTIGIESDVIPAGHGPASAAEGRYGEVSPELAPVTRASGGGRFRLPDGSDRFLVDAAVIESWTRTLGGTLLDPIKTTVVQNQRSMTTWVARK
jgi:SAM-dependent methyltransferase